MVMRQKTKLKDVMAILSSIDDAKLQSVLGTDMALYLVFLRYCSVFFGSIAIINIVFICLFVTGEPEAKDNFRTHIGTQYPMQALTILNATNTPWKMIICLLNSMFTITALSLHFILSINNKFKHDDKFIIDRARSIAFYKEEKSIKMESQVSQDKSIDKSLNESVKDEKAVLAAETLQIKLNERDIRKQTILMTNLDKKVPWKTMQDRLNTLFENILKKQGDVDRSSKIAYLTVPTNFEKS